VARSSAEDDLARLARLRPALETRARAVHALDRFLRQRGSLAVETPGRVRAPGMDVHLDAEPTGDRYLITSPELHMKRLVAAGYPRVHQICRCWRRGEHGELHNPEFTMLEWYWAGASYVELADELEAMLPPVAMEATGSTILPRRELDLAQPWQRITVREAYERHAGWTPDGDPPEERFFLDMVEKVEPHLGAGRPSLLFDYPASMAALSRLKPSDPTVAERFELYVDGVEVVNAFDELCDGAVQRARFEADDRRRATEGKPRYPFDERFLDAVGSMPRASGAALGVDRLVMLLVGADTIGEVIPFPETWL